MPLQTGCLVICGDVRVTEGAGWQSTCGTRVQGARFISQQGTTTMLTEPSQGTENQKASGREISSSSPTGIN